MDRTVCFRARGERESFQFELIFHRHEIIYIYKLGWKSLRSTGEHFLRSTVSGAKRGAHVTYTLLHKIPIIGCRHYGIRGWLLWINHNRYWLERLEYWTRVVGGWTFVCRSWSNFWDQLKSLPLICMVFNQLFLDDSHSPRHWTRIVFLAFGLFLGFFIRM